MTRLAARRRTYVPAPAWKEPTYADSTVGDTVDGEDLVVRRAAVSALGPFNGSVVVADPNTGRLLAVVNQKLAYKGGFQPCSTIKLVSALAGLNEGIINGNTSLQVSRRRSIDLTEALAHSNNLFFSNVGERLGFDRITHYAKLYGVGEKAALDIPDEDPLPLPTAPPSDGLGMMTSFGEGFNFSPLQLAALVSAIANGGTLYYLQHPHTVQELSQFVPRLKRQLDIRRWVDDIRPGMEGAVEYGTARRASFDQTQPILGKTGTCTDVRSPIHLGWFGSYNEIGANKLVVVVLLTGGGSVNGSVASGVAGSVYRNLTEEGYFGQPRTVSPLALVSTQFFAR
ncbi:MAG TPA: penicillin-binding transpeptidase domain-containing protein [Bryobacteraceae bacterium]|nr:penicillin-binding transpeptidase domain-containing protein [Bryobacteraceae bacterium]